MNDWYDWKWFRPSKLCFRLWEVVPYSGNSPTVWLVALSAKEKCEGEHFYE